MKTVSIILLALLVHYSASTQVWIDSGAVWHYDYWCIGGMGFIKYTYSKDTVIQDKKCQQIDATEFRFTISQYDSVILLGEFPRKANFTYVSGDTVFYLNNGEFFILYDFGAAIGDQWIISTTNDGFSECDDTSRIVVTDTGSIILNDTKYRYITVQPSSNSSIGLKGTYIERFGNIDLEGFPFQYLFPNMFECDSITGIIEWEFLKFKCFEDNSFTLYNPSSEDCEYFLTYLGTNEPDRDEISCYPNPAKDIIKIKYDFKGEVFVQIFSNQGTLVDSFNMTPHTEIIDISQLKQGMYLIKFQTDQGNFLSRIIKE
ncbi:MAG: T9SS type A sorting domain-containing protein [Bacteroidales bacterium]|nr:T9SS type A sorting domain-containing protein [Lentimicrobiaceae bacterium]MDD5695872.1 T9SS type A sorting domain-containing protein [Bacteroidales bacterium]